MGKDGGGWDPGRRDPCRYSNIKKKYFFFPRIYFSGPTPLTKALEYEVLLNEATPGRSTKVCGGDTRRPHTMSRAITGQPSHNILGYDA